MNNMKIGLLLKTNGEKEERELDMTPNTNNIGDLLNDTLTFVGQLNREPEKINAVIMYGRTAKERGLEKNKCKLPEPFDKEEINGDMFIICMDEDSEPQNFMLGDYNEYFK